MKLKVKPAGVLRGVVSAPPSKSLTHRAVIVASLAGGRSRIDNALIAADTLASVEACKVIGSRIRVEGNKLSVEGVGGRPRLPEKTIDVGNSGTTLRIMSAVVSLCSGAVTLTGDESIRKRPMQPLLTALSELGVKTSSAEGKPPITVEGPLKGGVCRIRGDVSSQFISGLLIVAPLAEEDVRVKLSTPPISKPYIDLTVDGMKKSGVLVEKEADGFFIPSGQRYSARDHVIEGDYSSAAFILAAAALTGSEVTVKGLSSDSLQGDRAIIDVLERMGAEISLRADKVKVLSGSGLRGVELDMGDTPDLVPITAVLGALAEGRTLIQNVAHLRFKESDRLRAVASELAKMGARIQEKKDGLVIDGVDSLKGAKVSGWNDHRIVMSLAVAGLRAEGETTIDSAESMDVSFPGFVSVMEGLGADVCFVRN
ncbi:MAG: 3-phosphoshikimate 1-carboxyvinyltransferase [Candidatus Altiarchaeota archaeon]|nr:3-phosphoshikimate 1-carboxyvinyltransferase [Candidatus Altiarchaeota archaeon]